MKRNHMGGARPGPCHGWGAAIPGEESWARRFEEASLRHKYLSRDYGAGVTGLPKPLAGAGAAPSTLQEREALFPDLAKLSSLWG